MTTAEALSLLRQRVTGVLAQHGLTLWQFVLSPDVDGTVGVHIVAGLAQDPATSADDGFDEVIASARAAEAEQRTQASIDDLAERLRRGGGFLDD